MSGLNLTKDRVSAMCINQNIGIDRNHPPRPSYARSRIVLQSASRNSSSPAPRN
jgi:hypothetical protein